MVTDLLVAGVMFHLLGGIVLAALVHQDATLRGSDRSLALAAGALVFGLAGALGYYLYRERVGDLPADVGRHRGSIRDRSFGLLRSLLLIVGAYLCANVAVVAGVNALLGAGLLVAETLEYRVALAVFQFLGFGVAVGGYVAVTREYDLLRVGLPTPRHLGLIGVGLVVLLGAQIGIGRLLTVLGIEVAQNQVIATGQQDPRYFLYMIPVAILLVGPFEELVFRGGVQGILRRTWGPSVAIAVSSALFGLVHWVALTGSGSRVPYVTIAAVLGLVLGYLYERTENIVVPAAIHGLYNSTLFGVQYLVATGMA
jgi:membrane protease YdiL (CAAX protease family)